MAYKYYTNKYFATAQERHDGLRQLLLDVGWTQHDQVASQYTIMKSDGDLADNIFVYVKIPMTSAALAFYPNWDSTTHANTGMTVGMGTHTTGTTYRDFAYADKNGFATFQCNNATTYSNISFIAKAQRKPANSFATTLTADVTSGTNKVIPVADVTNFRVGGFYGAFDIAGGRRQGIKVIAKDATSITANINTALSSGTLIGINVYPVAVGTGTGYYSFPGSHYPTTGGTNLGYDYGYISPFFNSYPYEYSFLDPRAGELWSERRLLPGHLIETSQITSNSSFVTKQGEFDFIKTFYRQNTTYDATCEYTLNPGDVQAFEQRDAGTSSGSNSLTVFNDTSKAWTNGMFAGKVLVITSDVEAGQVAKITTNTATSLTVEGLQTIPTTNTYLIADEAYRIFAGQNSSQYYLREGV